MRDFLARNLVPYRWYSVADPDGGRLLAAAGAEAQQVPVVVTTEGEMLVQPSLLEVANAVGLSTLPQGEFYDLVIVGGGPAGLGAAVYAASEGLKAVVVERAAAGGQAGQSSRIENYLGFPDGVSGDQLTDRARRQALRFGAELLTARAVIGLEPQGPARRVTFDDGTSVLAHAVVLATGVSYRQLDAAGTDDLVGRGVYYGSAATQASACAGDHVIIVGGANSAGQAAVFFARHAAQVTLAVRGDSLERSMSSYLIDQIAAVDTIDVRLNTTVAKCEGHDRLQCVTFVDTRDGAQQVVDAGHLVHLHRGRTADRLAARDDPTRQRRLRAHRPRPGRGRTATAGLGPGAGPVSAGDQRARRVRRRRRPRPVGQAGRVCRRRGCPGRHPGPSLSGRAVRSGTMPDVEQLTRLEPADLQTLFLFESLSADQLAWLSERGTVETSAAGSAIYREGEQATCFFVLLSGTLSMLRQVENTEVETVRTEQRGVYAGATQAFVGSASVERYPNSVLAVTDCTFWMIDAGEFGAQIRVWFPMAMHLLEG